MTTMNGEGQLEHGSRRFGRNMSTARLKRSGSVLLSAALLATTLGACEEAPSDVDPAAVENVDAMSHEHATDTTEPSPAADMAPARPVTSEELPYGEVGDDLVFGYFAFPADMVEPLPAVVMIHEWWGLNDNIRAMADRLAGEGYIVFAVDLYGGTTADTPGQAREEMMRVVENPDEATDNLRQALEFVSDVAGAPSVATLGWCFGGGWSLNAAISFPEDIDATVIFYGQVTDDAEKLAPIEAPVLGLFGGQDRGIPVDSVRAFEARMMELGKDISVHVYPDARHAFANPSGNRYDAAAAEDAWTKTLNFLADVMPESAAEPGS